MKKSKETVMHVKTTAEIRDRIKEIAKREDRSIQKQAGRFLQDGLDAYEDSKS